MIWYEAFRSEASRIFNRGCPSLGPGAFAGCGGTDLQHHGLVQCVFFEIWRIPISIAVSGYTLMYHLYIANWVNISPTTY